eukprot:2296749-Alexandrium_andersonii.AAC.1
MPASARPRPGITALEWMHGLASVPAYRCLRHACTRRLRAEVSKGVCADCGSQPSECPRMRAADGSTTSLPARLWRTAVRVPVR